MIGEKKDQESLDKEENKDLNQKNWDKEEKREFRLKKRIKLFR